MAKWKPTAEQAKFIRHHAQRATGLKRVKLEPGMRVGLVNGDQVLSYNEWHLIDSTVPTDLWSTGEWSDFMAGIELDSVGRAEVDFYVYEVTNYGNEMQDNVCVNYDHTTKELAVNIIGYARNTMKS